MFKRRASRLKQQLAVVLMVTLALQGSFMAAAGGWTFDKKTEIWTYHESEQLTNRVEDLKKGWFHDPVDGYWYYFNEDTGHMLYGWQRLAGTSYHFADIRNRENYFEEADGFWYYRENGRVPFGALLRQESSESGGGSGVPSTKPETVLPEQPTESQKPETVLPEQPTEPQNRRNQWSLRCQKNRSRRHQRLSGRNRKSQSRRNLNPSSRSLNQNALNQNHPQSRKCQKCRRNRMHRLVSSRIHGRRL